MPFLATILAALKGAKLIAWFLPGGQVAAFFSTALSVVWTAIKWTLDGIAACFAHPATFSVCILFAIAGAWGEARWSRYRVNYVKEQLQVAIKQRDVARTEVSQWRDRHNAQEKRADEADAARKALEAEVRAAAAPVSPGSAAPPQRVRQRAPAKAADSFGSWLPSF